MTTRLFVVAALLTLYLPTCVWADGELLWKVSSTSTSEVVPAYAGQPSPFPRVEVKVPEAVPVSSTEELEMMQRREEVLARANALLSSPKAFMPWIQGIRVGGQIDGAVGPRVLLGDDWVGKGQTLSVRVSLSPTVQDIISELQQYDSALAMEMLSRFQERAKENPTTVMRVQEIQPRQLTLWSVLYGTSQIPIYGENE